MVRDDLRSIVGFIETFTLSCSQVLSTAHCRARFVCLVKGANLLVDVLCAAERRLTSRRCLALDSQVQWREAAL